MIIKSGSYTGNGGASQVVTTTGVNPDLVIVKGGGSASWAKTDTMDATAAQDWGLGVTGKATDRITALGTGSFTVGSSGAVNNLGTTYYWFAIQDDGNPDFATLSYTGDGQATQAITGAGFQPDIVIVIPEVGASGAWKCDEHSANESSKLRISGGAVTDHIRTLDADGFTVGNNADVNTLNDIYHAICIKNLAGVVGTLTYTGDGNDDRSITGAGFQPIFVLTQAEDDTSETTDRAIVRFADQSGDSSAFLTADPSAANMIQSIISDGFTVGTSAFVNQNTIVYNAIAFGDSDGTDPTLTVTRADMTEDEVREIAGDQTIILTLMNATWDADIGSNAPETEDLLCGLDSAGTETLGWNNIVIGGACYSETVLDDSPAGYWRLGDASGGAADLSGNGNDGTYEGTQETGIGLIPNSAQLSTKFNDVLTKVSVPDTASAIDGIFDSGGTAEAIIRPWSDGGGDQGRIFAKNDTNGGWEFTVYNQSSGLVRLQFRHDFSTTDGVWVTAVAVPLSKANHVAVVYNNSDVANRPTIYINGGEYTVENGGLLEINAPVGTRVSDASSDFYIGNTASVQGALHFRGEIQEAALYTTELSKTRILEHLKAASNPFGLSHVDVVRTSDTVVTITLPEFPLYDISVTETITVTAVAATHSGSSDLTGTPTFDVTPTDYVSPYNPGSGDPGGGGPGGTDNPGGSEDNPPDGSTGGGGPGDGTGGGAGGDDDFGGFNGGLGSQSPQANRTLGDGDTYSFGLAGLGVGLDPGGRIRVIRIDAAEISESS